MWELVLKLWFSQKLLCCFQQQLAESGRKQLEQLMHQLQEQLQINLLQQTHMMQAAATASGASSTEKTTSKSPTSAATTAALQQLQIQQQQLISQLQLVQQRILMVKLATLFKFGLRQTDGGSLFFLENFFPSREWNLLPLHIILVCFLSQGLPETRLLGALWKSSSNGRTKLCNYCNPESISPVWKES